MRALHSFADSSHSAIVPAVYPQHPHDGGSVGAMSAEKQCLDTQGLVRHAAAFPPWSQNGGGQAQGDIFEEKLEYSSANHRRGCGERQEKMARKETMSIKCFAAVENFIIRSTTVPTSIRINGK